MQKTSSFLLATDFNQSYQELLIAATMNFANRLRAQVHLLHVIEPLDDFSNSALTRSYSESQQRFAEQSMGALKIRLEAGKTHVGECRVAAGSVSDSIVSMASRLDVDLIITGAGNISGSRAVGLTSQSVIEQAAQPVLVIHPGSVSPECRTILCPVDHSRASRRGLRNAIQLAKILEARLIVMSVIPEVSWLTAAAETGEVTDAKSEYEARWCEELDRFLANISFDGVNHSVELDRGVPHTRVIAAAEKYAADLIVMGATGRSGLVRVMLGSTTRRVLRDLPCSLMVVREQDLTGGAA
jgi:universal stress protein E